MVNQIRSAGNQSGRFYVLGACTLAAIACGALLDLFSEDGSVVARRILELLALGSCVGLVVTSHILFKRLRRIATELNSQAGEVASAAGQIAAASQALAQGTNEQVASLQETSASGAEIASMTRQNADHSRSAAENMRQVDERVAEANRTLEEMVVSMAEINASSDKIARIIKVIDEIAFQTNILALNAAVEAARAGEAGMGFAVVADEVRNLAQRSAQAAKNTAGLIEESISRSNEGSAKLSNVTAAIGAITEGAARVRSLIEDVNSGGQEQARGIEQISKAILQMQSRTQSSAASSEQSASAGERLNGQASSMRDVAADLLSLVYAGEKNMLRLKPLAKPFATPPRSRLSVTPTPPRKPPVKLLNSEVPKRSPEAIAFPLDEEFVEF